MIKCGNSRCSEVGKCTFWNTAQCDFFQPATDCRINNKMRLKKNTCPNLTEDGEQRTVIEYCEFAKVPIIHIPNEGKRTATYGAKLKAIGLRKGFPDLFIPKPLKGYHGLFIELKRNNHSYPTQEQLEWICCLNKLGYKAMICYGATAAIREIQEYFKD